LRYVIIAFLVSNNRYKVSEIIYQFLREELHSSIIVRCSIPYTVLAEGTREII